jgi:hypothetical protein
MEGIPMQSAQEKTVQTATKQTAHITSWVWLSGITISAVVALVAMFTISSWAEAAPMHHAVQHVLLFVAGVGFGASLVSGIRKDRV